MVPHLTAQWAKVAVLVAAAMTCAGSRAAQREMDSPAAQVTGVVVSEAGAAVPGVEVFAGDSPEDKVVTDREGKFLLPLRHARHPSVGYTDVVASAEGGKKQGLWSIEDVFEPKLNGKIVLRPSRELHVRVTDAAGAPVTEAEVAVEFEPANSVFTTGKTDANGSVSLWMVDGHKVAWVAAVKHGAGLDYAFGEDVFGGKDKADGKPVNLDLKLEGAQKFVIQAKDSQERFVSGAEFFPWYLIKKNKSKNSYGRDDVNLSGATEAMPTLICRTDKEGQAVVDWMPRDVVGKVPFLCKDSDWHDPTPPVFDASKPKAALSTQLLATIPLSGKVILPDGKPAANIIVQAEGRGKTQHYCRTRAQTGVDGAFTLTLYPEQSYIITVVNKSWAVDSVTGLELVEGDTPADVTLQLKKGTRVHGKISPDPKSPNRMGDVVVRQTDGKANLIRWPDVDASGQYEIYLGRGTYEISTSHSDGEPQKVVVFDEPEIEVNP